jgi:hypothetical protein
MRYGQLIIFIDHRLSISMAGTFGATVNGTTNPGSTDGPPKTFN